MKWIRGMNAGAARHLPLLLMLLAGPAVADIARVDSVNAIGHEFIFSNVTRSALVYRDLAGEARGLGYARGEARALQNLGIALYLRGRYDESAEAQYEAIRIYERIGMREELAIAYGDLGYQLKRRDLPRALEYMRQGIGLVESGVDVADPGGLYDKYGVLMEMNSAPDSAAFYYRKALDMKRARNDSIGIPYSLNNLAGLHLAAQEYAAAESLLIRSDAYRENLGDAYGLLVNSVQWGDFHLGRGDLEAAERRYRRSLELPGAAEQNYLKSYCYEQLVAIYEERGDFRRAFAMRGLMSTFRDSLVNVETNSRIAALEIEYETEKKDRELAENRLEIEARTRLVLLLVGVLLVLLVVGFGIVRYQHLKRRQLRRELELRDRLRRVEVEQRLSGEKLRISRELHDNIGAQLTFLISSLDNLAHGTWAGESGTKLSALGDFGRDTLGELRQTVWALKSEEAGFDALELRLSQLKRQCAGAGVAVELDVTRQGDAEPVLGSVRMLNIYRIAQEAVQNALKHAGAERITLRLEAGADALRLRVEDDGRGLGEIEGGDGSGVANMRHRCEELGGAFSVKRLARGTAVQCRIPLE